MPITSAGLLVHRTRRDRIEVLLGHMGGPFWARKDERAWSIPKGEHGPDEDPLAAARREFQEETGSPPPDSPATSLGELRQPGGKVISVWCAKGDFDPMSLRSNTFTLEWPPRSGRSQEFPEIDRFDWFDVDSARQKLVAGQAPFLDRLIEQTR